jgi:3-phosphoshikimate 1-carboxyvinyltransferase
MLRLETADQKIRASVTLPGSKSISNRLLVLKEILQAEADIINISHAEDTRVLAQALEMIRNSNLATLDIGQAGTDMRFLTALLSVREGTWILTGSERMKERPVGPLVDCLRTLGADITYIEKEGFPPLRINGKKLTGGEVSIKAGVSSQFISALLLISPLLEKGLVVHLEGEIVSRPYIKMTLGLLKKFGFNSIEQERRLEVLPRKRKKTILSYEIESDWSAASYYYSLCALSHDASFELKTFQRKSLQADSAIARIFSKLGVNTVYRSDSVLLTKVPVKTASFKYDFNECPDIAQTVAVVCFGLGIGASLTGLQTLRIKETDRIKALEQELSKLGARVEAGDSELVLRPGGSPPEGDIIIDTYGDHRMAMSFAPLALRFKKMFVRDPGVVSKSYPRFWEDLSSLGFSLNLLP